MKHMNSQPHEIDRNNPIVIHAPGNAVSTHAWVKIESAFFNTAPRNIGAIDDLTIITWNSGTDFRYYSGVVDLNKQLGKFEKSLAHLGIPFISLGSQIRERWKNKYKLRLTLDALKSINTKYVFCADSADVLLLDDPALMVEKFSSMDCGILFNGEMLPFRRPYSPLEGPMVEEWESFENTVGEGKFRYLNSGAYVGKVDELKKILDYCVNVDINLAVSEQKINEEAILSDQVIFKCAFLKFYPIMRIDYHCKIFQTISEFPNEIII